MKESDIHPAEKEPVNYLFLLPPSLSTPLAQAAPAVLSRLKQSCLLLASTRQYRSLCTEVFPLLLPFLKLTATPKSDQSFFVETLATAFFAPESAMHPREAVEIGGILQKLLRKKLGKSVFVMQWRHAFSLLEAVFAERTRSGFHIRQDDRTALFAIVPDVIRRLKKFFAPGCGSEIYAELKDSFHAAPRYIVYLSLLARTDRKATDVSAWAESLLALWEASPTSKPVSAACVALLGGLALSHPDLPCLAKRAGMIVEHSLDWIRQAAFSDPEEDSAGTKALVEELCRTALTSVGGLIAGCVKPGNAVWCEVEGKLVPLLRRELQPAQNVEGAARNAVQLIYVILYQLCLRIRRERCLVKTDSTPIDNKKPEEKLSNADIISIADTLLPPDTIQLLLLFPPKDADISGLFTLLGYLRPESTFGRYIPRLLQFCEDPNISHETAVKTLSALLPPLLYSKSVSSETQARHLNAIFAAQVKEVEFASSSVSAIALEMLADIMHAVPVAPDAEIAKKVSEPGKCTALLQGKMEEHVLEVFAKLLQNLEQVAAPNKGEISQYSVTLLYFSRNAFCNLTPSLSGRLFDKFEAFLRAGVHTNCLDEIYALISAFVEKIPERTVNVVVPLALNKLLKKTTTDFVAGTTESALGEFLAKRGHKKMMNPLLPDKYVEYYCGLLYPILIEAGTNSAIQPYRYEISALTELLLDPANASTVKLAKRIFYSSLLGATMIKSAEDSDAGQEKDWTKLAAGRKSRLAPRWILPTGESMNTAAGMIQRYGLDMGKFALTLLARKVTAESLAAFSAWLVMAAQVVPACSRIIGKCVDPKQPLIDGCVFDKETAGFFATLRPSMAKIVTEALRLVNNTKVLESMASNKVAKRAAKCIVGILSLHASRIDVHRLGPFDPRPFQKRRFMNPLHHDYVMRCSYYHQKARSLYTEVFNLLFQSKEFPNPDLLAMADSLPELMRYSSSDDWINDYIQAICNFDDPEGTFRSTLFSSVAKRASELAAQLQEKGKEAGEQEQRLLLSYTNLLNSLSIMDKQSAILSPALQQTIIPCLLLDIAKSADIPALQRGALSVLSSLERLFSTPILPIRRPKPSVVCPPTDDSLLTELRSKLKTQLETERAKAEAGSKLVSDSIRSIATFLTEKETFSRISDMRASTMLICTVSFLAGHFAREGRMLLRISNALTWFVLYSGSEVTRSFASFRLIEVLALRQRVVVTPIYVGREELEITKDALTSGVRKKYQLAEGERVFVDKLQFGKSAPPPYARFYPSPKPAEEGTDQDALLAAVRDPEKIRQLLKSLQKDEEDTESGEGSAPDSDLMKVLAELFEQHYVMRCDMFVPISAAFCQSLFELYGPALFPRFESAIEERRKLLPSPVPFSFSITCLSVVAGFLRAAKVFEAELSSADLEYCFGTLAGAIRNCPMEKLGNVTEAMVFFTRNRDPARWQGRCVAMINATIEELSRTQEKQRFWECTYQFLRLWDWRGRGVAECFVRIACELGPEKFFAAQENSSQAAYMAGCLGLSLFTISDGPETKLANFVNDAIKLATESKEPCKNIKTGLLFILDNAVTSTKKSFCPIHAAWLWKSLVRFCYRCVLEYDTDPTEENMQVSETAQAVSINLIVAWHSDEVMGVIIQILEEIIASAAGPAAWKAKCAAAADLAGILALNWAHAEDINVPLLISKVLRDPEVEVRTAAAKALTAILVLRPETESIRLVEEFKRGIYDKSAENHQHANVLGIISVFKAYETLLPDWAAKLLGYMGKLKTISGEAGESVRVCLSEFWERHRAVWEYEKGKFDAGEAEAISGHVNPYNYFG